MPQFAAQMVGLLADVTLLNRTVYGGPDALQSSYLHDYDASRDPDNAGNRDALFVYDRYDLYLAQYGQHTLSSAELGFDASVIGASESSDGLDHNFTYTGDLFRNNYMTTDGGEVPFKGAGAVALVTVKTSDEGKTLFLTLRGTDADGSTADGEAGTANGQMRYYEQLKGLIDQVYDYVSDPSHDISDVVVSGHSLGGAMADIFALYDGARFADISGVKLSVVALASAGVAPQLLTLMPAYDKSLVHVAEDGSVTLDTPDWYFQYDQANDIVRNPDSYSVVRHASEDPTQALITAAAVSTLKDHLHFEDHRLQFETPAIDQYAVSKNLETNFLVNHYADFYELIGTEFSKAWPLAGEDTYDRFIALFGHSDVLDGTGTNNVNGWGVSVDNTADYRSETADLFLLGFSGQDTIRSGSGADFLSGGADSDKLRAGRGADILLGDIAGASGDDVLFGGQGADILRGGLGDDRLHGGFGTDTFVFGTRSGANVILDFAFRNERHDVIDLSHMAGIGSWSDLRRNHITESDGSLIIDGDHGETIEIRHMQLDDLDRSLFIL